MKGFLVVSGCPRSGTSLCMDIQRVAHGDEAIVGQKFPQEARQEARKEALQQQPNEPDHAYRVRKYLLDKQIEAEQKKHDHDYVDMNPQGFWECAFSVRGLIYRPNFRDLLGSVRRGDDFKVVKVVSQGLLASDPAYIGKVIYMIRHPRAVAKSQERLVRGFSVKDPETGSAKNAFEDMTIHTPEMYIGVTVQACRWLLLESRVPVMFVDFDDLVGDPQTQIDHMAEFVGSGDYDAAKEVVEPRLNRSQPEDIEHRLWKDAEYVYEQFVEAAAIINSGQRRSKAKRRWENIIRYFEDPRREFNREKRTWRCYRSKHTVNEAMCRACYDQPEVMRNFKKHSESMEGGIARHWREEPCLFECGLDLDRLEPYLTIEESIENNFWVEAEETAV